MCPRWDSEPRKPGRSFSLFGASPKLYGEWLAAAAARAMQTPAADERIVFINAWNEWAEGAYLEPDRHHGYAYLLETRRVLDGAPGAIQAKHLNGAATRNRFAAAKPSVRNLAVNLARRASAKIARKLLSR